MILRKLIVENFRQIYGRAEISFALPGPRNVTVVLGQNGAGKTTLLNAFLWCLYDRVAAENPNEVVSHKAVQDAAIGSDVAVEVTLVVADGSTTYTISRRREYRKLDGGKVDLREGMDLRVDAMGAGGVSEQQPDPKQFIEQMLPEGLQRFFFFRGEDMESLALQSSQDDLKKGVEQFLNFTLLDRAMGDLQKVRREFEKEIARIAVGDTKLLTDEIAKLEESLESAHAKLDTDTKNFQALDRRKEEIDRRLAEYDELRPYFQQKDTLTERKKQLELREEEERRAVAKAVSDDGYLWKSDDVCAVTTRLASEAVERGEIPARIKPTFVDDLLNRGTCICGNTIDDAARTMLLGWKGKEGLAVLEEAINDLRNSVTRLETRRTRVRASLVAARQRWAETQEGIRRTVEEISTIDSELQGKDFHLDEIRGLQASRRSVEDERTVASSVMQRSTDQVASIEAQLMDKRDHLSRLKSDNEELVKIQKRGTAVTAVEKALKALRSGWLTVVQEYLDGQLKQNWQKVAQLDRLVAFTPDFHLTIQERGPDGGWALSAPSSANLRALALCFVSALIKLAHDMGVDLRSRSEADRRYMMFQGGEYPIVMDAPFATMDRHFKQVVPSGLREVVPQMVLFTNSDQWSGGVEDTLRQSVGATYVLELHIAGDESDNSPITIGGRTVDYVVAEADASTDWTLLKGVEQ